MAEPLVRVDASDFKAFSKAMRNADRDLQNAMRRAVRAEVNTTRDALRSQDWRPVEGQLRSKWSTARMPIKRGQANIVSKVSGTRANVSATRSKSMSTLNRGFVRHPLFGDRSRWFSTQESTTGWWDRGVTREAPRVVRGVSEVLDDYATRLAGDINTAT